MKFGAQLSGQSVHEWRAHNILYNDLKLKIRNVTTGPSAKPRELKQLSQSFFNEYENFALVLKSKLGEIDYRISKCEDLVSSLAHNPSPNTKSQFDREISHLTRDLQNFSRFSQAQYRGFRKLLKKYHKWSNGGHALDKFSEVLYADDSAAYINLTPRFLELSALWNMARDGRFEALGSLKGDGVMSEDSTDPAAFDAQFLAQHNSIRVWVPSDQVLQVFLTLLPHLRLEGSEQTTISFFDNSEFSYIRNSRQPGQLIQTAEDESSWACVPTGGLRQYTIAHLNDSQTKAVADSTFKNLGDDDTARQLVLSWFEATNAVCYAKQHSLRTRYSLEKPAASDLNDPTRVWAIVDENITLENGSSSYDFPHAVLEIRWRGEAPLFLHDVEESHMVWPLSESFSLASAAALTLHSSTFIGCPSWLRTLEENVDIRRVERAPERGEDRLDFSGEHSASSSNERPGSKSRSARRKLTSKPSTSILLNQAPELEEDDDNQDQSGSPATLRYWNEFDYPDEEADFAVFVGGNESPYDFIGVADKISQPIIQFSQNVRRTVRSIRMILSGSRSGSPELGPQESDRLLPYGSPRLLPQDPYQHYESFPIEDAHTAMRDMVMAMLSCVCYLLAGTVIFLALSIIAGDLGVPDLPPSVRGVIMLALLFGIAFSALATAIFNLQTNPSWLGQVLAQCSFFGLVCTGAGGIAWVATT